MKTTTPPYILAPKIAYNPIDINELIIRAIMPAFIIISAFIIFNSNPPVSPLMLARLIILELCNKY